MTDEIDALGTFSDDEICRAARAGYEAVRAMRAALGRFDLPAFDTAPLDMRREAEVACAADRAPVYVTSPDEQSVFAYVSDYVCIAFVKERNPPAPDAVSEEAADE